ncbi:MAG: hypothetical protein QOJ56_5637 [Mycobacterium sp.]|nr:hypothetical protein [Mycobacterium sp.]
MHYEKKSSTVVLQPRSRLLRLLRDEMPIKAIKKEMHLNENHLRLLFVNSNIQRKFDYFDRFTDRVLSSLAHGPL